MLPSTSCAISGGRVLRVLVLCYGRDVFATGADNDSKAKGATSKYRRKNPCGIMRPKELLNVLARQGLCMEEPRSAIAAIHVEGAVFLLLPILCL